MRSEAVTLRGPGSEQALVMPPPGSGCAWYCLNTRPRREKKVATLCRSEGIPYYLPLRKNVKHYGARRREHSVPHFPGYLFCCVSEQQRYLLTCSGHLARALRVHDQEGLLRDLRQIRKALQASAPVETFPYLKRGRRVRITRGPFRGVEGLVSERRGAFRVVLNIDFIQRALAIELDAEDVRPV